MLETIEKKRLVTLGVVYFLIIVIPLAVTAFVIASGMFKLKAIEKKGSRCH